MAWYYWLLIIAAILGILVWYFRRNKAPTPAAPRIEKLASAPGVIPSSGELPPNPPPPPPPSAPINNPSPIPASLRTGIAHFASPTGVIQNIPLVGKEAAAIAKFPVSVAANVTNKVNTAVTAGIEHIPVAGKVLAAPQKAFSSAVNKVFSNF